jgi:hypothetical protein
MVHYLKTKYALYSVVAFVTVTVVAFVLYVTAQMLLANVLTVQLKRAGYPHAVVENVRLYLDGIVVGTITLNEGMVLRDVYTDQSAPDIAQNGLQNVIIRHMDYRMPALAQWRMAWPFPQVKRVSIENMRLTLDTPKQDIVLHGTVKSLQAEEGRIVLLMPFSVKEDYGHATGRMEMAVENGILDTVDFIVEDASFQDADLALKRVNGWMNIQSDNGVFKAEAQFTSGSVLYEGHSFSDGMAQYSFASDQSAQWTVTLNRPADHYFNTWVIKETTRPDRYAVHIAAQRNSESQTRTQLIGLPVRLEVLLPLEQQEPVVQPD